MLVNILSAVQGIECGLVSTESKRLEDSVKAGRNNYLTAIFQTVQGSKTLDFADRANKALGLPVISWAGKAIVYLTPTLLAILKSTTLVPEKLRPILTFFQNHLSTFYQIAAVIYSISLLFFGQPFFAIPSLLVLGIGFMDRNGWLPFTFRQFLHRYSQPLLIVTGLASGGILDRVFAMLNALSWCANTYLSQKKEPGENWIFKENLTPQKAMDFLHGRVNVKIDQKFIRYNPIQSIPHIDIQFIIEKFDQINWERQLPVLRQKLMHDARFIEQHRAPHLKTDQEIIDITKHSLQMFISAVKERRVLEGEPANYEKLHNYLKIIAKYLEVQNDETLRTDILFRLAVEGGEYCGPGKFEVAESVYVQTVGNNPDIPFKDKVAYCLQSERNRWIQKFYSIAFTQNDVMARIGRIIDWQDVHNYNLFVNLYGDEFGLLKAAADNDDTALVDPIIKWVISHTLKGSIEELFWIDHTLNNHTQTLVNSIGTSQLPKPEVYAFWLNWIERQQIEEQNKAALREELQTGRLYDRPLEINQKMSPEFVTLMLLDMGIVEIVPRDHIASNLGSSLQPIRV